MGNPYLFNPAGKFKLRPHPVFGPNRKYSERDLEIFAEMRWRREIARPAHCSSGASCWVEKGPPAYSPRCGCLGCRSQPAFRKSLVWGVE
jgi:hypothetical protein